MKRNPTTSSRGSFLMPAFENALVSDEMRHGLISCAPETTLRDVARMMAGNHVHAVVVLRDESDGDVTPWGVVSDIDVLGAALPGAEGLTAGEVAGTPAVMVSPADTLEHAAQLMREHDTSHLIVVDPVTGQPVGVISTLDVAGAVAWGEA